MRPPPDFFSEIFPKASKPEIEFLALVTTVLVLQGGYTPETAVKRVKQGLYDMRNSIPVDIVIEAGQYRITVYQN